MKVKKIMSEKVVTLSPEETLGEVVEKFFQWKIGGAPVVDEDGKIVGIITDSDIFKTLRVKYKEFNIRLPPSLGLTLDFESTVHYKELKKAFETVANLKVKAVMKKKVITCSPNDLVEECVTIIVDKKINRLPVVKDGKIVGIIGRRDIIRGLLG
jgi:CBS domain-containing protein